MTIGDFSGFMSCMSILKKSLTWYKAHLEPSSSKMTMKLQPYATVFGIVMLFIVYEVTNFQYQQTQGETRLYPFDSTMVSHPASTKVDYLPRGIVQAGTDMELRPLWSTKSSYPKVDGQSHKSLLAIPAGIKQRNSVDAIVRKFLSENFVVILFHYDGDVNGWQDLQWYNGVIHVAAQNQTKWWFAKRFLHPDVVSIYDYIFLWDEDLGVEDFHPGRYVSIVKSEGLEISQPALNSKRSEIHHWITIRKKHYMFHRRVEDKIKCLNDREAPPCTGWVEGMAPVFSRSAWRCTWHLIQNDLIHGWGMDMKFGYCAQGDRRKKVGVVDREFIVHLGVPTLGGPSTAAGVERSDATKATAAPQQSRRRAESELRMFQDRWDAEWVDPFQRPADRGRRRRRRGPAARTPWTRRTEQQPPRSHARPCTNTASVVRFGQKVVSDLVGIYSDLW